MADQFVPLGDPRQMALQTGGSAPLRGLPTGQGGPLAAGPARPNMNPIPALKPQGPANEFEALINYLFGGGTSREGFDKAFEQRTQSGLAMADRGIKAMKENNAERGQKEQELGREQRRQGSIGMLTDAARLNVPQYQNTMDMLFEPSYTPSPQELMSAASAAAPRQTIPSKQEVADTRARIQQMPAVRNGQQLEDLIFTPPLSPPPPAATPQPQPQLQPQADLGSRVQSALKPLAGQDPYLPAAGPLKAPGRPFRMASPQR